MITYRSTLTMLPNRIDTSIRTSTEVAKTSQAIPWIMSHFGISGSIEQSFKYVKPMTRLVIGTGRDKIHPTNVMMRVTRNNQLETNKNCIPRYVLTITYLSNRATYINFVCLHFVEDAREG